MLPKIEDSSSCAKALIALISILPSDLIPEAFRIAGEIKESRSRVDALIALFPKLPSDLIPDALKVTSKIEDSSSCAKALIALISILPSDLIPEAFRIASEIKESRSRADALIALFPKLPSDLIPDALKITDEIEEPSICADTIAKFAPHLPNEWMLEALNIANRILQKSGSFSNDSWEQRRYKKDIYNSCAAVLLGLIPYLPSNLLPRALEITSEIEDLEAKTSRINALRELDIEISEGRSNSKPFEDDFGFLRLNSNSSNNLPSHRAHENEEIDKEFCAAPRARAKVLATLYYYFKGDEQLQIFESLLATIEEIPSQPCKARTLILTWRSKRRHNGIRGIRRLI